MSMTPVFSTVTVRPQDIEPIRLWRNAQMKVLRQQKPITSEEQAAYYDCIWRMMLRPKPTNVLVSLLKDGVLVGYGGLTYIHWEYGRAEVAFLADPQIEDYEEAFTAFLTMMKADAIQLGLHRLYTETYDLRPRHIEILEKNGFECEGELVDHVRIDGMYVGSVFHGWINEG